MRNPRPLFYYVSIAILLLTENQHCRADGKADKIRAFLKSVHSVGIAHPMIGTETLAKYSEAVLHKEQAKILDTDLKLTPKLNEYASALKKIESTFQNKLPERFSARTSYSLVEESKLKDNLKELELTPSKLFVREEKIKNRRFPTIDKVNCKRLIEALKVDALLIAMIDEPRRNSEHYYFEPLSGFNFRPSNVQIRACFWLVAPDGNPVLISPIEVLHPLSKIGKREYLMADWIEAEELAIENFLDELTLYTPEKKRREIEKIKVEPTRSP